MLTYRGVRLRSLLEYSFVKLMEGERGYVLGDDLMYEPIRIPYVDSSGKRREYVPDFLTPTALYEVKTRSRVYDKATVTKNAAAAAYCAEHGLRYHILSEASIRRISRHEARLDPLVSLPTRKRRRRPKERTT